MSQANSIMDLMGGKNGPFVLRNIDSSFASYEQMINLYQKFRNSAWETIDISFERWFAANMCSALGGVLDRLEAGPNRIRLVSIPPDIKAIIQKNQFLSHFGFEKVPDHNHTTIKYLKLRPTDVRFFHSYVASELLNKPELPTMSLQLKKKITESIYEIFVNAKIHSETEFIYTCGQFYPNKHKIEFTITDTGIGFKNRINRRFNKNLSAVQAIRWAANDGHSTKIGISGGIGLAILKEFVQKNRGKFQIVSDNGYYQFDEKGEVSMPFAHPFPGTVVNLQFRTDDSTSYSLRSEISADDIF